MLSFRGWETRLDKSQDCRAQVLDSGALELLREAAGLLKNLNGEDDKNLGFWCSTLKEPPLKQSRGTVDKLFNLLCSAVVISI